MIAVDENSGSVINGYVTALSPVVHNEIFDLGYTKVKGAANKQRMMTYALHDEDGNAINALVPVVSGNSIRGIARRLLFDFSFAALETTIGELIPSNEEAKRITYFFRNGGLTPKGFSPVPAKIGTYAKIRTIPWLGLLGGVYLGHQFGGSLSTSILMPVTRETLPLCSDTVKKEMEGKSLPPLSDLQSLHSIRYTRRADEDNEDENRDDTAEKDPEAMIFGTEYIPAGTVFDFTASIDSDDEGVVAAFFAALALLSRHGKIGGMNGRGHGYVKFQLGIDEAQCLERYEDYLVKHKDDIIANIRSIPTLLESVKKEKKEPKKGKR